MEISDLMRKAYAIFISSVFSITYDVASLRELEYTTTGRPARLPPFLSRRPVLRARATSEGLVSISIASVVALAQFKDPTCRKAVRVWESL
jgi:hypothetical protein